MTDHALSRRTLIASGLAAGASLSAMSNAGAMSPAAQPLSTACDEQKETVLLFQGDSITDAGRDRRRQTANDSRGLGRGYPMLVAGRLLADAPGLKVHNRGISGNKVPDLQNRWKADCLDVKPDILSILIGVNDIWHKLNGRYEGTIQDYADGYRKLLNQTMEALPETRIVICEPFVLKCGAVNEKWFPEFDERREAALTLAKELKLTVVPFQSMFNKALEDAPPQHWAGDGVHPSLAGHSLMAKTWCEVVFESHGDVS